MNGSLKNEIFAQSFLLRFPYFENDLKDIFDFLVQLSDKGRFQLTADLRFESKPIFRTLFILRDTGMMKFITV